MTFGQQVLATMIGAAAGFMFSLVLFYLKEYHSLRRLRTAARKNLRREFDYNILLIKQFDEDITKAIEMVSADDRSITYFLSYARFQRAFVQQYYFQGLLFEYFDSEDVAQIDNLLIRFAVGGEAFVNRSVDDWRTGQLDKPTTVKVLSFQRDQFRESSKILLGLLAKLA